MHGTLRHCAKFRAMTPLVSHWSHLGVFFLPLVILCSPLKRHKAWFKSMCSDCWLTMWVAGMLGVKGSIPLVNAAEEEQELQL